MQTTLHLTYLAFDIPIHYTCKAVLLTLYTTYYFTQCFFLKLLEFCCFSLYQIFANSLLDVWCGKVSKWVPFHLCVSQYYERRKKDRQKKELLNILIYDYYIMSRLKNPTLLPFCVKAVQLTLQALSPEPNIFLSGTSVVNKLRSIWHQVDDLFYGCFFVCFLFLEIYQ